ncbi:MAG: hypothetical protein HRU76_06160 [Phycisphaeraceae bacterium]|nr:MAG: hypothetical protein HRU76_06160 [Phycisphaeraceae bacterium]
MKTMLAAASVAALLLTGCGSSTGVSLNDVTGNMTPEVMTLNQRGSDVKRHMAYTHDVNGRLFWEDLGRTLYLDHPSRLNPIEIVSVSGKPH